MRYPPVAGVGLGAEGALSIRRAGAVVVEGRLVIFLCIVLCSTRDDDLVEVDEQDCVGSQSSRNQTTTKLSHGRAIFKETAAVFPFNGTPIVLIGVFVEKGHRRKTRMVESGRVLRGTRSGPSNIPLRRVKPSMRDILLASSFIDSIP